MTIAIHPSSFRDPDGFLFTRDGVLYRQVNPSYAENYQRLMESGLHQELVTAGHLVACEEVSRELAADDRAVKVLRPERIPFVSWPYEWSFRQLQEAALTTLAIQKAALQHDMTLKDASAYNVQFRGAQAVFIDTLSFEVYREGEPWVAYRQFCEHFVAPLALISRADVRLSQLLRANLEGIPVDLASRLLPTRTWLIPSWLTHLHLHAMSQKRFADRPTHASGAKRGRGVSRRGFLGLLDSLETCVRGMRWQPGESAWSDYYATSTYSEEALEVKSRIVDAWLERLQPSDVWDLGANTGVFSRLASARGISTIAFDLDPQCVDTNYRDALARKDDKLLPLQLDLANPSPACGWHLQERASLLERGPTHTALALALIHHLTIGRNVPFAGVVAFLHDACQNLIIEFVPKHDEQVQRLLASRKDVFPDYTQEAFETALKNSFTIVERREVSGTERTLYLAQRRS